MGSNTRISWTDSSWTPLIALNRETGERGWFCVHASEGCRFCYSDVMNTNKRPMGNGIEFKAQNRNKVDLQIHWPTMEKMAKSGKKERVFVCSMTDLFLEDYPYEWIAQVFAVMWLNQNKMFQVLTKRARRMHDILSHPLFYHDVLGYARSLSKEWNIKEIARFTGKTSLPNVWLGVTTEDQKNANERIPLLLDTPAAIRFVSYEPAISAVDFSYIRPTKYGNTLNVIDGESYSPSGDIHMDTGHIDWFICGGESGDHARPFDPEWCRELVQASNDGDACVFIKQMGENCIDKTMTLTNRHGDKPEDWHPWLRVQQFPEQEFILN